MPIYPTQFSAPIASQGDKNTIPQTANFGDVSILQGYDPTKSVPLNLGGKEVSREDTNGFFYAVSDNIYQYQVGVKNYWRQYIPGTEQTTQARQTYQKGALVWINKEENDNSTAILICSKVDNNLEVPVYANIVAGSLGWRIVFDDYSNVKLTRGARIIKGINESTMNGFLKLDGSKLTTQQYNAIPADIRPEITKQNPDNSYSLIDTRGFNKEILEEGTYIDSPTLYYKKYANGTMEITGTTTTVEFTDTSSYTFTLIDPIITGTLRFETIYYPLEVADNTTGFYGISTGNPFTMEYKNNEVTIISNSGSANAQFVITYNWYETRNIINDFTVFNTTPVVLQNPLDPENNSYWIQNTEYYEKGMTANIVGFINPLLVNDYYECLYSFKINQGAATFAKYFPATNSFALDSSQRFVGRNLIYTSSDNYQYDTVQQVLLSQTANVTRETTYSGGINVDGTTIKVNAQGDAYVNLNPAEGSYDETSGFIELTPEWDSLKNVPSLVTTTQLNTAVTTLDTEITDISTNLQEQITALDSDKIPLLVNGSSYVANTLCHYNTTIYRVLGNFTWDGNFPNVNLQIYSGVNIDNLTIKKNGSNELYVDFTIDSRWIIVDANTKYLKDHDGTMIIDMTFTIPATSTQQQTVTLTFPQPFFLGAGELVYRPTISTLSCLIVGTNTIYYSQDQYLTLLRTNALPTANGVTLNYSRQLTNAQSGIVRVRISGFWKNPNQ